MNLKGSKTEKNLLKTFAGESRARNKYDLYAEKAKAEGYMWIAEVFECIALNEFAHAREVYKRFLDRICSTKNNLIESAISEAEESKVVYKNFENMAREEGFYEIADFYKELQEVEEIHKEKFLDLAKKVKDNMIFSSEKKSSWECLNCGYIYEGCEAPKKCPLCKYPKSYFKQLKGKDCK
ncbi:MAG: rubrerythrin family protein [Clostridium butyricum]|nr:rubrerythrin family protein [Clostridium butyricum]